MRILKLVPVIFLLSACAAPVTVSPLGNNEEVSKERQIENSIAFEDMVKKYDNAYNVFYPLTAINQKFCGEKVAYSVGMTTWNIDDVEIGYKSIAGKMYGLYEKSAVANIADKSPAAKAGIHSGDLILDVNGKVPPEDKNAKKMIMDEVSSSNGEKVIFHIERKGKEMTIAVKPELVCDSVLVYDAENMEINAYSDGERVVINKGMMGFVKNDNEIALVLSHELAHNAMGHISKKRTNAIIGSIGGIAVDAILAGSGVNTGGNFGNFGSDMGSGMYSVEFEQEADYVGMYFMERAGYNSKNVANFWRRYGIDVPKSQYSRKTHPISPERYIAIDKAYQEISSKRAEGKELIPKFKTEDK